MDRRAPVIALALAVALAGAAADAGHERKSSKHTVEIHLRSLDRARRVAVVDVVGVSRSPAPNLFTFTDERGRHYVGVSARCDEETAGGVRACRLVIPSGYEKHALASLVLHLHGLHGREVEAAASEIDAANAATGGGEVAPDGGNPDGGR